VATALVGALRRGVAVDVIGDATQQESGGLPVLARLRKAGARVYLDGELAASHNKIVIVDAGTPRATVITGSYNFTHAAQARNAENVVLISGSRAITDRYAANFETQRSRSRTWP
jgi:phosphatidylserine/phosphatidylglycerophosphate/cardiolipin synthase-like enzyme